MHHSERADAFDRLLVFAQPPGISQDRTCFIATALSIIEHKTSTMDSKKRKLYAEGLSELDRQDLVMTAALGAKEAQPDRTSPANNHACLTAGLCIMLLVCMLGTATTSLAEEIASGSVVTAETWTDDLAENRRT